MAAESDCHFDEEASERYSMGTLSGEEAEQIEEHLLICEACRRRVAESDTYVAAMRQAAARVRRSKAKPKTKSRTAG
ncbi:MAG: zf-HC2 domain-containing protein [Bryobacteraceae bacterium]